MKKYSLKKLLQLYFAFLKIGAFTFGGGLAMLPMMEKECVEKNKWIESEELLNYIAIGQCTPGVIAVNVATFVGYKLYGWLGAVFSTLGVISPSMLIISIIAAVLSKFMGNPYVVHAFAGIRVAVSALLVVTVINMIKKSVKETFGIIVFLLGVLLALFTPIPTVIIVVLAGIAGIAFGIKTDKKVNA